MAKNISKSAALEEGSKSFRSTAAWEKWLAANHATAPAVWIRFAKKGAGIASVVYKDALDVALCYGWIDGQVKSIDETCYQQRFTPRRARSKWSKINCKHVARLISSGRMRPAGLKQIEVAKADGRWDAAYDSPKNVAVPDDLLHALTAVPAAKKAFATLSSRNRYAILYGIHDAKRADTRIKRIAKFVKMLADGKTPH